MALRNRAHASAELFPYSVAKGQRRPRIPGGGGRIPGGGMPIGVPLPGGIPIGGPIGGLIPGGGPIMPGGGAPRPIGGGGPPRPGGYWVGARQYWLWQQLQQLQQYLFLVGSSPVGMARQPHGLAQQVLQEPEAWEPQPGFLCQQPCRSLGPRQLQQAALEQYQYLWEEVPRLSLRPDSPLAAAPDRGLASLPFLLVWSSLA